MSYIRAVLPSVGGLIHLIARRLSLAFLYQILESVVLNGKLSIHLLEFAEFTFEQGDSLRVKNTQSSVAENPFVVGGLADTVLAANIFHTSPFPHLIQDGYNLVFVIFAAFHRSPY